MPPSVTLEYKNTGLLPLLERKSAPAVTVTQQGGSTGIVEAYVAVTGIRDDVGDIIEPGAFTESLAKIQPKMCLGHDWNRPIGEPVEIIELMPGDSRLPSLTHDGKAWPAEAGALWTRSRYMLDTDDGRNAYAAAMFYGPRTAYSIGYVPHKTKIRFVKHGGEQTRMLPKLDLYEYGPVLHGANDLARQAGIKSIAPYEPEIKVRLVRSMEYWGLPVGTPIRPGMTPRGPVARKREREGKPVDDTLGAVEIDPNNPHSTRVKPTAKGKNKRNDGTFESNIIDLFLDGNTDPADDSEGSAFVTSDPANLPDRQRINKGAEYNPLDMLVANGVTPADLEDDLRAADWSTARSVGEVQDDTARPEVQTFIDDVMDVYREKYNAALVQQNAAGQRDDIAEADDGSTVTPDGTSPATRSTTSLAAMGPAEAEAAAREMDDTELAAHETELTARAAGLGKPGERGPAHEAIVAERERRKGAPPADATTPADRPVTPPADEPVTVVPADTRPQGTAIPSPPQDAATTPTGGGGTRSAIVDGRAVSITSIDGDQATVYDGNTQESRTVPVASLLTGGASSDLPVRMGLSTIQREVADLAFADAGDEAGAHLSDDRRSLLVTNVADAVTELDMAIEVAQDNPDRRKYVRPMTALRDRVAKMAKPGDPPTGTPNEAETIPGNATADVPAVHAPSPVDGQVDTGVDSTGDVPAGDAPTEDVAPLPPADAPQFEPGAVLGDDGKPVANVPVNDAGDHYDPHGDIVSGQTVFDEALNHATDAINDGDSAALAAAIRPFTSWVEPPNGKFRFDARGEAEGMIEVLTPQEAIAKVQAWTDEANAKQGTQEGSDRADTVEVLQGVNADYLAEEAARLRGVLIERSAAGASANDGLTREAAMRLRAMLAEQARRADSTDTGEAPTLPTSADVATITAEEIAETNDIADASHGIHEADDGEFEVEPDIADRQDRIAGLLTDDGPTDFTGYSDDALRSTRVDVVSEMRLQDYLEARRSQERAATKRERENATTTPGESVEPDAEPTGPKPRPGVAGAAEDAADALDEGDEERIQTTLARLDASLRRSRSDSEHVAALRGMIESGQEVTAEQLRATAEAIRVESRTRRNEQARDRRRVRRFERERLRSLLTDVESAMSGRGLEFDAVPEAGEDLSVPSPGAPGAGSWSSRNERIEWLGRDETIREVSGQHYSASISSPSNGKSVYEWSVTAPDGTAITGRGEADSVDDAVRMVETVLDTHRALGNLPVDAVLPQSMPARDSSAQTLGEFVAGVDGIRDRLATPGAALNPLTGERDPIRAQARLRPPADPVFTSPDQVRQHLLAALAAENDERLKTGLQEAVSKIRWDDVQLTKGGGLAVFTYAGQPGAQIMHTMSGQRINMGGVPSKSDLFRIASIMEALPDRNGRVIAFDQNVDDLKAAMVDWEAEDGSKGINALRDRAKAEMATAQLRAGKFTAPSVRDFVDGKFYWGSQTNPDRKSFVDIQMRTIGYLLTNSNADKVTKNAVTGSRAYLKAGTPDLAVALLRRRAGELREQFGAKADEHGAIALEDAATGLLSMWSPQASPGTRARRMKAGERITFAENDGVRTFRAINDMRAEGAYGGVSSTLAIDESNGTVYRLHIGPAGSGVDGIAISPQFGGGYPIIKTELGGDKFVISGDGEEAPTEADQVRPRNLADAGSVPPEVIDSAATLLPETAGEIADRRAATPAGTRAPRRGAAGAPARRAIPQPGEVAPLPGEQHLAAAQARLRAGWLGTGGVELADKADGGGFTSVEQWREWATEELARIRRDEPTRERSFAVIETPDYETVKLSPGGHFLVTKSGYVVHARSAGAVWGVGDGFQRLTGSIGEVTVESSMVVADYLERTTVDGDRMNWQAPDIAAEISRFHKAHNKTAILVPAARLAYQDFAATNKKPLKKKEADTLAGLIQAAPGYGVRDMAPNPEAIHALDLPGMIGTYYGAGRGQARSKVVATSKAGTELAKKIEMEIGTIDKLYQVAPLDAALRLNRLADTLGDDTVIELMGRDGAAAEPLRPAADLRAIAAGITDAFDETKVSPAGLMRRSGDTGRITAGPKAEISAYRAAARPQDTSVAAESGQQLKASPEIRVWRDDAGHLHASFLDFRITDHVTRDDAGRTSEDHAVLGTGADGRFSATWTDRKTGAALRLELPSGSWEFEPETIADPAGSGESAGPDRTGADGATLDNGPVSAAQAAIGRDVAQVAGEKDTLKDLDVEQLRQRLADAQQRAGTDTSVEEEVRVLRREIDARESAAQDVPKAPAGDTAPAGADAQVAQVEQRIKDVYDELALDSESWISMADLRDRLGEDIPRAEVDRIIKEMSRAGRVHVAPESNRKTLTDRDHAAALRLGNEEQHILRIDPTRR